jgi:hypothetical protein
VIHASLPQTEVSYETTLPRQSVKNGRWKELDQSLEPLRSSLGGKALVDFAEKAAAAIHKGGTPPIFRSLAMGRGSPNFLTTSQGGMRVDSFTAHALKIPIYAD